jgi:hypothetical protein
MAFPYNHICVVLVDIPSNPITKKQPKIFLPIKYDEVKWGIPIVSKNNEVWFVSQPRRPILYLRVKMLPPVFHGILKSSLALENFDSFWFLLNTNMKLLSWFDKYNQSVQGDPKESVAHYLLSKCLSAEDIKRQLYLA